MFGYGEACLFSIVGDSPTTTEVYAEAEDNDERAEYRAFDEDIDEYLGAFERCKDRPANNSDVVMVSKLLPWYVPSKPAPAASDKTIKSSQLFQTPVF